MTSATSAANTTETDAATTRRMVADISVRLGTIEQGNTEHDERLDRIEGMLEGINGRLGDVIKFAERVEAAYSAFQAKGLFGMIGGFSKR